LLIGEETALSYNRQQRFISRLIHEIRRYRLPKWFSKIGAFLLDQLPFGDKQFIKCWMINFFDDHDALDRTKAKELINWSPKHPLQSSLKTMIENLKKNPIDGYKSNQLPIPLGLGRKLS
jgi:UDP-glucose 4-epimerase